MEPSHPLSSLSSCPQSFPASWSFPMSQLFTSGGQSCGASASASVLPMNIQDWFPLGLTSLMSLLSKGLLRLLQHHRSKASILWQSAFFMVQLSHPYMTTGKTIALTIHFLILCLVVIGFIPRSKCLFFFTVTPFFKFIFINWRLITLQYCSGFCHTLTWISHKYTYATSLKAPSLLYPIPLLYLSQSRLAPCIIQQIRMGYLLYMW